jgi:hypothetical protein
MMFKICDFHKPYDFLEGDARRFDASRDATQCNECIQIGYEYNGRRAEREEKGESHEMGKYHYSLYHH